MHHIATDINTEIIKIQLLLEEKLKGEYSKNKMKSFWLLPSSIEPNGTNFHPFFTPLFSFAIESYIYKTDFRGGLSKKISLLSPLVIGSKLTFISSSGR